MSKRPQMPECDSKIKYFIKMFNNQVKVFSLALSYFMLNRQNEEVNTSHTGYI